MTSELIQLKKELDLISIRIHSMKRLLNEVNEIREAKNLQQELKELQYQALFY